jgi:hypothetical protein
VTPDCWSLSEKYEEKDFPAKYWDDGLQVAVATVHRLEIVVSWNLKHTVKWKTRREVKAINILEGLDEIEICNPLEVIEND